MKGSNQPPGHIVLTSHPRPRGPKVLPIHWGAPTAAERGPVIGTLTEPAKRNVIGAHAGSYAVYRALAVAAGSLSPMHRPDLRDTTPAVDIGPFPQWSELDQIVSLDPWGHLVADAFADRLAEGYDIRPTIAVTRARLHLLELKALLKEGRLRRASGVPCSSTPAACSPSS
jgi:hypothetical protein